MKYVSLIIIFVIAFSISGCTLYQSGGRKAIETNQGGLLGAGINSVLNAYYNCEHTFDTPDFLKEGLEVVDTPFESQNYSILYDRHSSPPLIAVYSNDTEEKSYRFCKVYMLKSEVAVRERLTRLANFAIQLLENYPKSSRP